MGSPSPPVLPGASRRTWDEGTAHPVRIRGREARGRNNCRWPGQNPGLLRWWSQAALLSVQSWERPLTWGSECPPTLCWWADRRIQFSHLWGPGVPGPRDPAASSWMRTGRGDVVVPAPRPGAGGWSCAPGRLVGVGIALSPVPVFRRDCESPVQPERKEKERWKGGGKF